jgi:hypothetical protein
MKHILLIIGLISVFTVKSIAQPNGGFENWSQEFSYEAPDGWQTFNVLIYSNPPSELSAFKVSGIDKHSGNYALKLKSVQVYNNVINDLFGDTAGGTYTGKIIYTPFAFKYGFAYSERAQKLDFWAKYHPVGTDTGGVIVFLSKWTGSSTDTVAIGALSMPSTPVYSHFELDLEYHSEQVPDSATIFFYTSQKPECARLNSTLYVDDVLLSGWVPVNEEKLNAMRIKAYPNPSRENITIEVLQVEASKVKVMDISGRQVGDYLLNYNKVVIDTRNFKTGLFFYEVLDAKDRALAKGKFNVIK